MLFSLTCDHNACEARWPGVAADGGEARRVAGGQGWRRVGRRDLCPLHARGIPTVLRPACDAASLEHCSVCGGGMHRGAQRNCRDGHPLKGNGDTCKPCRADQLKDPAAPRRRGGGRQSRGELLDAWVDLAGIGVGFRDFARERGISFAAWERAYLRARAAGDPRAVRLDRGERAA